MGELTRELNVRGNDVRKRGRRGRVGATCKIKKAEKHSEHYDFHPSSLSAASIDFGTCITS